MAFQSCNKHIEIQFHVVCELIIDEEAALMYYLITENIVNIFMKALGRDLLERHLH